MVIEVNVGRAKTLSERVLQDLDNDLAEIVNSFRESSEPVWHIDRHVLDVTDSVIADQAFLIAACAAGLSLLHKWSSQRSAVTVDGVVISEPYLMIDDEWLEAVPNAPPPHVYVCISDDGHESVEHEPARDQYPLPVPLAQLLTSSETYYRVCGAFDDMPGGAWLIRVCK